MNYRVWAIITQIIFVAVAIGTFDRAPASAAPQSYISCGRTVITALHMPAGPYGYESGGVRFANRHTALLMGFAPEHWRVLRVGDHVMTCFNADPIYLCHHPIMVIDFDADFMFESSQGPEGTC
ncbi:MAG: hypothetical protein ACYDDQ_02370 [Vulcanimicrobiaceae bacterium]